MDYKILATIIANRLSSIIGSCVDSIKLDSKGRYLKNIRKVINFVNKAQTEITSPVLLFLNAEKAFKHIEWQYLHNWLKSLGLENSL